MNRSLRRGLLGLVVVCLALVGLSLPAEAATKITPGVAFTLTVPAGVGKTSSYTFTGVAGKRLVVAGYPEGNPGVIALQLSGPGTPATVGLPFGPYVEFGVLPAAGTWTLKATNLLASKATGSVTVSLVTPDVTGAPTLGTPVTRSFSPAGQNTHLTFKGTAGQKIGLQFTKVALVAAASRDRTSLRIQFRRPDGSVFNNLHADISAPSLTTWRLDAAGTWTIDIDPQNDTTGSATLVVKNLPDKVLTPVLGKTNQLTLPGDGTGARFAVNATAGQRLTFGIPVSGLGSVQQPQGYSVALRILDPQGKPWKGGLVTTFNDAQWIESSSVFDAAGKYTVVLDPSDDTAGPITYVPNLVSDPVSALTLGTQQTIALSVPGQNPVRTFTGTAGQHLVVTSDQSGLTAGSQGANPVFAGAGLRLLAPDGTELSAESGSEYILPTAGTWRFVIDPFYDTVGPLKLTVRNQLVTTQALTLGAVTTTPVIAAGDVLRYRFSAVSGRRLGFDIRTVALSDPARADLSLIRPDGTRFDWGQQVWDGAGYVETPALDATGTWTLQIDPLSLATGTLTLVANQPAADVTGTITPDKQITTTLSGTGQQARYTFTGTAGRFPVIDTTAKTWKQPDGQTPDATFRLIAPNGTDYAPFETPQPYPTASSTSTRALLESWPNPPFDGSLNAGGTWTLVVDPRETATGSQTFTLRLLTTHP